MWNRVPEWIADILKQAAGVLLAISPLLNSGIRDLVVKKFQLSFDKALENRKAINDRKYEIGMLKAIGYKNKNIKIMLLFENLVIGIGAYLIGLVISIISMYSLKIFVFSKNIDFDKLDVNLNIWVCLIALIFSIIVPTIASYLGGKGIFNKTPLSLNKGG